jgi:hypothetical protein
MEAELMPNSEIDRDRTTSYSGLMPPKRSCIFCSSTDLTKEHLLPDWMHDVFGKKGNQVHSLAEETPNTSKSKLYESRTFTARVRFVCKDCNHGWMSDLEENVKPLLVPMMTSELAFVLRPAELAVLSTWAAKTTVVLFRSRPNQPRAISDEQCAELHQEGRRPAGVQVWIGRRGRDVNWPYRCLTLAGEAMLDGKPAAGIADEYNVWQAMIAVGHVVFYVFGHRLDTDQEVTPGIDALTRIDPAPPRLVWPTQPTLEMLEILKIFETREVAVRGGLAA